ncbi:MAG: hypothetical protein ACE5E1_07580 [Phycisphaerae bacterium]
MAGLSRIARASALGVCAAVAGCAEAGPEPVAVSVPYAVGVKKAGRVFIAGRSSPEALKEFRKRGVETVIDLRLDKKVPVGYPEAVRRSGLAYVHLPMASDALTDAQASAFLKAMRARDRNGVLIQCGSGNRAGGMYGLYYRDKTHCRVPEAMDRARKAGLRNPELAAALRTYLSKTSGG